MILSDEDRARGARLAAQAGVPTLIEDPSILAQLQALVRAAPILPLMSSSENQS